MMTKKQEKEIVARIDNTQKLLKQFGLNAYAFDPGVRCTPVKLAGSPRYDDALDFGWNEWTWLEPLLRELLKLRAKSRKQVV